jgi:hypothetical protein
MRLATLERPPAHGQSDELSAILIAHSGALQMAARDRFVHIAKCFRTVALRHLAVGMELQKRWPVRCCGRT